MPTLTLDEVLIELQDLLQEDERDELRITECLGDVVELAEQTPAYAAQPQGEWVDEATALFDAGGFEDAPYEAVRLVASLLAKLDENVDEEDDDGTLD
jgi:hypothetical protein